MPSNAMVILVGILARGHDKVVFQLPVIAVIDQINAWDKHSRTAPGHRLGHSSATGLWIVSFEVIAPCRAELSLLKVLGWDWPRSRRMRSTADSLGVSSVAASVCVDLGFIQGQHRFIGRQKQAIARSTGEELYLRIGLALVGFKAQRDGQKRGLNVARSLGSSCACRLSGPTVAHP